MFFKSIFEGLSMLLDFKILYSIGIAATIAMVVQYALLMLSTSENGYKQSIGCLSYMLLGSLLNVILVSILVARFFPYIFGFNEFIPLSDIFTDFWPLLKAGLIAAGASLLFSIIPIVGNLYNYPGFDKFIQSMIIFHLIGNRLFEEGINVPGFFSIIGYGIVCSILAYLVAVLLSMISIPFGESGQGIIMLIFAPMIGYFVGFGVLFMYTSNIILSN